MLPISAQTWLSSNRPILCFLIIYSGNNKSEDANEAVIAAAGLGSKYII